jgi:ADP-dependent phosphofructokinase/glucokinase
MDWIRLYSDAMERFEARLPSSGGLGVAFNTNIDGIVNLEGDRLERFFSSEPEIADEGFRRRTDPPGRIDQPVDFVAGLMHFIERGSGGEYMIHREEVYNWIVDHLPVDHYRMGGNAGIMANALSGLGAKFVIPHAVQLPERQAKLFLDRKNILLPVIADGGLDFASPGTACRPDRELVHLILEFKEGTSFNWRGKEITSPRNNRYIVNADDYNGKIAIDPAFARGIEAKLPEIDRFVLTGLHMLKREYPDGQTHTDRLKEATGLVAGWQRAKESLRVHFEMADIQDEVIRDDVLRMACAVSDSVGMNEDEFEAISGFGNLVSAGAGRMTECMYEFLSEHSLGRLLIHSRDFVMSLLTGDYGVDPSVVRDAQMIGILSSQNRAYSGGFGSPGDLKSLTRSRVLESSPTSLDLYEELASEFGQSDGAGIWSQDLGEREAWVVFTPCLLSKVTLNTVGLGDCLTAGTILAEIPRG